MSIEAMKLALEHIEGNYTVSDEEAITALRQAIEQAQKQEPAFYAHDGYLMTPERAKFLGFPLDSILALYTSTPQRQPLTDWEVEVWAKKPISRIALCRAIEAAHGIKGEA